MTTFEKEYEESCVRTDPDLWYKFVTMYKKQTDVYPHEDLWTKTEVENYYRV